MYSAQLVAVVLLISSASALDSHQLELKQHYEHLAYIADFPCLHPQPKVISVHKLFSEGQSHGKAYFPDVTVLHRCDECTGSCTSGKTCSAKESQLVLLPFKATYLHDTDKHKQGSWQMEYHELLNHTECACAVPLPHDSCHNMVDGHVQTHQSADVKGSGSSPLSSSSRSPDSYSSSSTVENIESTTKDYLAELFERNGS